MNKKLKRMAVVGATVLMTASSVGFSNAMQVKKSCDLNLTGKMYVCINGKRFKLDLSCASIFDTLKWFNNTYLLKLNSEKYEITVSRSKVKNFRELMNI